MTRVALQKRLVSDFDGAGGYRLGDGLAIDQAWTKYVKQAGTATAPLTLDFRKLDYIDHDSLLHLGSIIRFRKLRGYSTRIELPTEKHVWDFLRSWRFPEFIETVAETGFTNLLTRDSLLRLKSDDEFPTYVKVIELPGGGMEELLPTSHFQITPIRLTDNPLRSATLAQEAWLESHFLSVLDAYLDNQGHRIGTLVVLEAVMNAAMHPGATMAYTSSQIVLPKLHPATNPTLQIGVWDDGQPMALTLRRRLEKNQPITSAAFGAFEETFHVRLVRASGREELRVMKPVESSLHPDFPWLSVAAFMAGVSSSPERESSQTGGAIRGTESEQKSPGMGLRYIRRNVLNLWGGSIRYWVNNYRIAMRAASEPGEYEVSIFYRPKTSWPLQGNLIYLDIPLRLPLARENVE